MGFAYHIHDPCPHCPCGCVYFEDTFPGSSPNPHWSLDAGSASIAGGQLTLTAGSALSCNVLSADGTPYGVVLAGVDFPSGAPSTAAVRLACNYTDPNNYAFAEYRADGTVHVGTRSGGTDTYAGTWFQADVPILGTYLGGTPLTGPLPFQLCYTPTGIIGTAQYRADSFDASQVGAGTTAAIASSKCGIVAIGGSVNVQDFRLSQHRAKVATCPACAPACGQWQYSDIDAILSYHGLCNMAPEQFILDLGPGGLAAGVTGVMPDGASTQPCDGCTGLAGDYILEFCPWDASGANHDPAPWANGQCYPAQPVPPSYAGAPNVPGGPCKWCYYGATALCDNDTLFQAGLGIFPAIAGGNPGYQFQVDLYIASLPIPNPFNSQLYNVMNWQAHYQSAAFDLVSYPNCTDPFGAGPSLELSLTNQSAMNLFGGPICGAAWPTIMVRY
jgi:hypothetical protein